LDVLSDEFDTRKLPPRQRLDKITQVLKNERDESIRWESIWLVGEITEELINTDNDPIFDEIADLLVWVLQNDDNGIVKHEAAFQIAVRNMRAKIPYLVNSALNDKSELVRHEATEALGFMRARECKETLRKKLEDPSQAVRETAVLMLKRLDRRIYSGEYTSSKV
jgi:HEAT repeat protein